MIRTGLIGYGKNGSTMHSNPVEELADFVMTAVCDISEEARKKAGERFDCPVYEGYIDMLNTESLDLVIIVTPTDLHFPILMEVIKRRISAVITKPWTSDSTESSKLMEAIRKHKAVVYPWLPMYYASDLRRLRELINEGRIGRVFGISRVVNGFGKRFDWQTEKKHGGGYLSNWGPHILYPAYHLLGLKVLSAYGLTQQVINPGDSEDVFQALLTSDRGISLYCEYSQCAIKKPNWLIQGDRGTIEVREQELKLVTMTEETASENDAGTSPQSYNTIKFTKEEYEESLEGKIYGDEFEIYRDIAQAIRGDGNYPVLPEDAHQLSLIIDAIKKSSQSNTVVEVGKP